MERSTVSPDYHQTLDNLAETLRADRQRRFIALLQQTDTTPFIPKPAESSESVVQLVP